MWIFFSYNVINLNYLYDISLEDVEIFFPFKEIDPKGRLPFGT